MANSKPKSKDCKPYGDHNPVSFYLLDKRLTTYNLGNGLTDENFKKVMEEINSDIVFCQKIIQKKMELVQNNYHIHRSEYQGAILVKKSVGEIQPIDEEKRRELNINIELDEDTRKRQCAVIIKKLNLIAINWHGTHKNTSPIEKLNDLRKIQMYAWNLKTKTKNSVIIGGDFNVTVEKSHNSVFREFSIVYPDIEDTDRRECNIDYFLFVMQDPLSEDTPELCRAHDDDKQKPKDQSTKNAISSDTQTRGISKINKKMKDLMKDDLVKDNENSKQF